MGNQPYGSFVPGEYRVLPTVFTTSNPHFTGDPHSGGAWAVGGRTRNRKLSLLLCQLSYKPKPHRYGLHLSNCYRRPRTGERVSPGPGQSAGEGDYGLILLPGFLDCKPSFPPSHLPRNFVTLHPVSANLRQDSDPSHFLNRPRRPAILRPIDATEDVLQKVPSWPLVHPLPDLSAGGHGWIPATVTATPKAAHA